MLEGKDLEHDIPSIAKTKRVFDNAIGIKKPRMIRAWHRFDGEPVYAGRER
jgi:hypothetical protein